MAEALLSSTDIEEALSCRYVQAVAARAGFTTSKQDYDRDGIDLQIQAGGRRRPRLDVQLKATINLQRLQTGEYSYSLKAGNYAQLIGDCHVPRILIVLELPRDPDKWLEVSDDELRLRRRAYWCSLAGKADVENKAAIAIHLPKEQVFNVEALKKLMDRAATGSLQ